MAHQRMTQIQVRIDTKTKKIVRGILDDLGLDLSTAVKMLCKQIQYSGTLPFEIRDANGFTPQKAQELRKSIHEVRTHGTKRYRSVRMLMKDILT